MQINGYESLVYFLFVFLGGNEKYKCNEWLLPAAVKIIDCVVYFAIQIV